MHTNNIIARQRRRIVGYFAIGGCIFGLGLIGMLLGDTLYMAYSQMHPELEITPFQHISNSGNPYTVFWKTHMEWAQEAIKDKRSFPLEEIQEKYNALLEETSGPIRVNRVITHMILDYADGNTHARAGSFVETNDLVGYEVTLELFIPRYKDMYADLEKEYGIWADSVLKIIIVSDIMYQVDRAQGHDDLHARSMLCKDVFTSSVEKHHIPLPKTEREYYAMWVQSERNEKNPSWIAFVSNKAKANVPKNEILYEP